MPIGRARLRGVSTSLDTSGIRGQMRAMIYLDYQATTPLAPEARGAMLRWLEGPGEGDGFAKPASTHQGGRHATAAVEVASNQVEAALPERLEDRGEGNGGDGMCKTGWVLNNT